MAVLSYVGQDRGSRCGTGYLSLCLLTQTATRISNLKLRDSTASRKRLCSRYVPRLDAVADLDTNVRGVDVGAAARAGGGSEGGEAATAAREGAWRGRQRRRQQQRGRQQSTIDSHYWRSLLALLFSLLAPHYWLLTTGSCYRLCSLSTIDSHYWLSEERLQSSLLGLVVGGRWDTHYILLFTIYYRALLHASHYWMLYRARVDTLPDRGVVVGVG